MADADVTDRDRKLVEDHLGIELRTLENIFHRCAYMTDIIRRRAEAMVATAREDGRREQLKEDFGIP